jgi:hypothetical protein
MSVYLTEQERIRKAEQARLDEERRKKEEAERQKLNDRAAKAEEKGRFDKAEQLREKAEDVYVPPVVVQSEIEKTTRLDTGTISQKKDFEITIIDPLKLVQAVAAGIVPISIIKIDESKLKAFIKLQQVKEFPGCELREVVSAQFRGKVA